LLQEKRRNERSVSNVLFLSYTLATLLVGIFHGLVAVLVDVDHIVCALSGHGVWAPSRGLFGCRLYHHLIMPVALYCISLGISLGIGWFMGLYSDVHRNIH